MDLTPANKQRLTTAAVWACRIIIGLAFIVSGWAKSIDPWGFLYKIGEYFAAWGWEVPREMSLTAAVGLSCVEFCTGILIATGSMKRVAVWVAAAMMAFMLPLTAYIAVANPVPDCGCFGDFIILSNTATFVKNLFLAAGIVFLILKNTKVAGLYPAPIQWLEITVALAYPLFLAFVGYQVQPVLDFRPYRAGTLFPTLAAQIETNLSYGDAVPEYLYEKDGERRTFTLDDIPDSTWTFVEAVEGSFDDEGDPAAGGFAVYDSDGNDVADGLVGTKGRYLVLVVTDPGNQYLSRAHYINELYRYASAHGTEMFALVGASGSAFERWTDLIRPAFPAYSVEDTSLKELVRGDAGVVYVADGVVVWKQTLSSMDDAVPESRGRNNVLDLIEPVDSGRFHLGVTGFFLLSMLVIYLLGLSPKILNLFRKSAKNP